MAIALHPHRRMDALLEPGPSGAGTTSDAQPTTQRSAINVPCEVLARAMSNGPVRLDGRQVAVRHVAVATVVGVIAGSGAAAAAFVVLPYLMDLAYGSWAESMGLVFPVATAGIGIVGGAAAGNIQLDAHSSPVTTIANWTPRDAKPGPGMADYIATMWTADDREYKPGPAYPVDSEL